MAVYANLLSRCTINILLKFIILYFNNFILPRPRYLYVILVRHNELPEDYILNVETCRSMLFETIKSSCITVTLYAISTYINCNKCEVIIQIIQKYSCQANDCSCSNRAVSYNAIRQPVQVLTYQKQSLRSRGNRKCEKWFSYQ